MQDVVDHRGLTRTRHTGDGGEHPQRELDIDVLEVVLAGPAHHEFLSAHGTSNRWDRDGATTGDVLAGDRFLRLEQTLHGAGVDHRSPVLTGTGPDVDDVIGDPDGVLIVFDDEHGVAEVTQSDEGVDETPIVALMQTDRGLVEHVEHTDET